MSLANLAISSLLASSMATPTICRPCAPYCLCNSTNHGISILHGVHHVAQKLSSTALPRKSDRLTLLPSRDSSVKSGASVAWVRRGCSRFAMCMPKYSIPAATTATTTRASGFRPGRLDGSSGAALTAEGSVPDVGSIGCGVDSITNPLIILPTKVLAIKSQTEAPSVGRVYSANRFKNENQFEI